MCKRDRKRVCERVYQRRVRETVRVRKRERAKVFEVCKISEIVCVHVRERVYACILECLKEKKERERERKRERERERERGVSKWSGHSAKKRANGSP